MEYGAATAGARNKVNATFVRARWGTVSQAGLRTGPEICMKHTGKCELQR